MLPEMTVGTMVEDEFMPSKTPKINISLQNIAGDTDGIEAVKQAIYLLLGTERYNHIIYSWNYGVELADLIGKPTQYVIPELKHRITEALLTDDRIVGVTDFETSVKKRTVSIKWTTKTIYGNLTNELEVMH